MTAASDSVPNDSSQFGRWPGLLTLSLGLLLGPVAALVNEGIVYATNMWKCGGGTPLSMHVVALICLAIAIGAGLLACADWARVGRGTENADATIVSRTRFIALTGMAASAISALLILMQWLAVFVFGTCVRS